MADLRAEFAQRLEALERTLSQTTALQERQATMVQQLHAENQSLRQGELAQALKPFILDVARLHDDVHRVISHGGEALASAASIPEFILDVLDRHGVTQIAPGAGDTFDSKFHQGLRAASTANFDLDGRIESVIRPGFVRDGTHLVRPAQVVVYRYEPSAATESETGPDATSSDTQAARAGAVAPSETTTEQAGSDQLG